MGVLQVKPIDGEECKECKWKKNLQYAVLKLLWDDRMIMINLIFRKDCELSNKKVSALANRISNYTYNKYNMFSYFSSAINSIENKIILGFFISEIGDKEKNKINMKFITDFLYSILDIVGEQLEKKKYQTYLIRNYNINDIGINVSVSVC